MNYSKDIPWKRLSAEAVAIVGSILLAFAIDAWWEDRQQAQDQEALLTNLHSVLSDHREYFRSSMEYTKALRQSARQLLSAAVDPEVTLSDDELDKLISDLTWYVRAGVTPELTNALTSASLEKLSNQQLIVRLRVLHGKFSDLDQVVLKHDGFYWNQLMPFLQKNASLLQLNSAVSTRPGSDVEYPVVHFSRGDRVSHRELLNDREFQNILVRREWRLTDYLEFRGLTETGKDIDGDIDQILQLINQELGN